MGIQCDENKPVCHKCVKAGCVDRCKYRDLTDISFRNESEFTAMRAQKTWRSRAKVRPDVKSEDESHDSRDKQEGTSGALVRFHRVYPSRVSTPEQPLSTPVEQFACSRFFFDYSIPDNEAKSRAYAGVLDYLPGFYYSSGPRSSLHAALEAAGVANFDRRCGAFTESFELLSKQYYGEALRLVKAETQDPKLASSDELMMAVHLLGLYEVGHPHVAPLPFIHVAWASTLLVVIWILSY